MHKWTDFITQTQQPDMYMYNTCTCIYSRTDLMRTPELDVFSCPAFVCNSISENQDTSLVRTLSSAPD